MPQASLWFASPFKDWIGQRTISLSWEGSLTLRDLWERLAAEYPKLRANLPREGVREEAMGDLAAVIVDGDILTLDSVIRDGAKVDVLTPLSGGRGYPLRIDSGMPGVSCVASTPVARDDPAVPLIPSPVRSAMPPASSDGGPRPSPCTCGDWSWLSTTPDPRTV